MIGANHGSFRYFMGRVEDVNDPRQLGRVKIRVYNLHDFNMTTDKLPWASILMPAYYSSTQEIGKSPTGIIVGALIVGFFLDGDSRQIPVVWGTLHQTPTVGENQTHDVNKLARGQQKVPRRRIKHEPRPSFAAEYPYNQVIETRAGHVIEVDDTPSKERIHVYHKSGSYLEIQPDGKMIIKTADNSYDITKKSKVIYAEKDILIEAGETIKLTAGAGITIKAPGGITQLQGSFRTNGTIGGKSLATGSFTTPGGQTVHVADGLVTTIYGG